MKKKILKISGIILLLIFGALAAVPFLLESKIGEIVKNNVNNNVNATLDFSKAELSLIRSFPQAEVQLTGVTLINNASFVGDTLFATDAIELKMGIGELFKSPGETITIKTITIEGGQLNIMVDHEGNASYDIGKETETEVVDANSSKGFELHLESYGISDFDIHYHDLAADMHLDISAIQHQGKGDLSLERSELQTNTNALVSLEMDSTKYLSNNKIQLEALIDMDLAHNTYTFLDNKALINQLPLVFEGYVKVNEDNQELNIEFNTPSSDFKNFLALIPEAYSKNIEGVKTTGECIVDGFFKGVVDDEHIPKFAINITSNDSSFKYPELPKTVEHINLDMSLNNVTGVAEDTYVAIKKVSFSIANDRFNLASKITELLGNTKIMADLDGVLNLANLSQAYPLPKGMELSGLMSADISTAFDMASLEQERYERTKTSGTMVLEDFEYNDPDMKNPVTIHSTALTFNPTTVTLNELSGTTGSTDFEATGTLDNFLGFVFNKEKVKGEFNLNSNNFTINDFMMEEDQIENGEGESNEEHLKIPSFLDCTITSSANTVQYDNLILKDVKGNLRIVDEKVSISDMSSTLFNGKVSFNGEVSTKEDIPSFTMILGMAQLGIGESFESLELFKALAPIAGALRGTLNSDIELSGKLNNDFTPNLTSVTGKVLAELLSAELNADQAKILSSLGQQLNFIRKDKLDLKGLKTALSFEDGIVKVTPFSIAYDDITINITGSHTFDRELNYKATLDVPARYLGAEVNSLIASIDENELDQLTIPVVANIGGKYTNPEVSTDLASGVKGLTSKLVQIQKNKLINKGKESVGDLLGGIISGDSQKNDSVPDNENDTKEAVKGVIGDLLGGKSQSKDSTATKQDSTTQTSQSDKDPLKEATKSILGGLLGGKKKKDSSEIKKDSVN